MPPLHTQFPSWSTRTNQPSSLSVTRTCLTTAHHWGHLPSNPKLVFYSTLSTPLIYLPRSRPPTSPPSPLYPPTFTPRLDSRADWQASTTTVQAKRPSKGSPPDLQDIESKLYLHATRIFPIVESIPFYLSFLSSSTTLAAFMPFGPQTPGSAGSSAFGGYQCTRMRLMRQVIMDAKNPNIRVQSGSVVQPGLGRDRASSLSGPFSSSSEMWDMTTIGEGSFQLFVSRPFPLPLRTSALSHTSQFIRFVISLCRFGYFSTFFHCYRYVLLLIQRWVWVPLVLKTSGVWWWRDQNHGPDWITFYGEIPISDEVRVSGFRTAGLLVRVSLLDPFRVCTGLRELQDFLSLTMVPPDPAKSPFKEFHQKVPIRLTTDPWT